MPQLTPGLKGQRIVVTGAGRGIGAEVARILASRGARVAIVGRSAANIQEVAAAIVAEYGAGSAQAFQADITDLPRMQAAVAEIEAAFGGIDAVVANAGVASYGSIANTAPEAFEKTVIVNLVGNFHTAQTTLPALKRSKGYFLVVASLASFAPGVGFSPYGASKAAVESMIDSMRYELKRSGVKVGIAHPSWVDTDMVREADSDLPSFHRGRTELLPYPYNATAKVADCANAIVEGVAKRKARIYVPKLVGLIRWNRWIFTSPGGWLIAIKKVDQFVREIEAETEALGRAMSDRNGAQIGHTPKPEHVESAAS